MGLPISDRVAGLPRYWRVLEALHRRQRDYVVLGLAVVNTGVLSYDVTTLVRGLVPAAG